MNVARRSRVLATGLVLAVFVVVAGCSGGGSIPSVTSPAASPAPTLIPSVAPGTRSSPRPTAQQAGSATPAQAEATVRRFVPTGDLTVTGPATVGRRELYTVDGSAVHAQVDAVTGALASLLLGDRMPSTPAVTISTAAARSDALAFLTASGLAPDGLTPTVELVDHGDFQEYSVTWQRRINGAIVPDQRLVSVNPQTGSVFSVVIVSVPYEPPPAPTISQQQAVSAAQRLLGASSTTVDSSDLLVTFDANGTQLLVWQIGIRINGPTPSAAMVQVDAMSGVATVIGRG